MPINTTPTSVAEFEAGESKLSRGLKEEINFSILKNKDLNQASILSTDPLPFLHRAVALGLKDEVERLHAYGVDFSLRTRCGKTPLGEAFSTGDDDLFKLVLERGADPHIVNILSEATFLHLAVRRGRLSLIPMLLGAGADINAQSLLLRTPLHLAAQTANRDAVSLLLALGADCEKRDIGGSRAVDIARDPVIKGLLEGGVSEPAAQASSITFWQPVTAAARTCDGDTSKSEAKRPRLGS